MFYRENAWKTHMDKDLDQLMAFNEDYKDFISRCKTERECVDRIIEIAKEHGFKDLKELVASKTQLKAGDKVYVSNYDRQVSLFVMGEKPLEEGMRILGAHLDSPRIDVKQNPLYESDNIALMDTHYYGGIKKYQWVTMPLALHGVIYKKDGTKITVNIGEDENDPVVGISDVLPHLGQTQAEKKSSLTIEGEDLDIMVGNMPVKDEDKDAVKANVLNILKQKYDIVEEDLVSAEIEAVPAGKARDYGLDSSMIMGYGHDDRVCAYTSMMAILEVENPKYTTCALLVDKEEIGSVSATGMDSMHFENTVAELLALESECTFLKTRHCLENSKMLSSDVSAAYDPLYASVYEKKNTAILGHGMCISKYTGSRGKAGSNDANPEYMASLRQMLDANEVHYQTCELGKVDQGGGGTIAWICARYNMEVIDAGVPVISMHSPNEVVSKVDVYEAYRCYKTFLENA